MTPEQEKLAFYSEEIFVIACPGAGKSTTIVERVKRISQSLPLRKGIAILSFTNSAIDTFTGKCKDQNLDIVLSYPNFVGTFDAFIRQFIVSPGGIPGVNKRPLFVDSWNNLGIEVRITGGSASKFGISLDKFDPESNTIDPSKIGHNGQRNVVQNNLSKFISRADVIRKQLRKKGYLSASDARVVAKQKLQINNIANHLAIALKNRFTEIIVDEAQDCNPDDIAILRWFRQAGIPLTIVSDPDQAIYEFRKGSPQELIQLGSDYKPENQCSFTKNFRSSQPICDFSATLRARNNPDEAEGPNKVILYPIQVIYYSSEINAAIGQKFIERVKLLDPSISETILLSHKHLNAIKASGHQYYEDNGNSKISIVTRAVHKFWGPLATNRDRETALKDIERIILNMMGKIEDGDHLSDGLENSNLSDRELRRKALELITSIPSTCEDSSTEKKKWVDSFFASVDNLGIDFPSGKSAKKYFPIRQDSNWHLNLKVQGEAHCRCSNIHQVKGGEFEAVCVVIPKNKQPDNYTDLLFNSWEKRIESEAKRVIYVGITRAEKILSIAVPITYKSRLNNILNTNNVSFEQVDI